MHIITDSNLFLSKLSDTVESFHVACRCKYVIKFLLQHLSFTEWPSANSMIPVFTDYTYTKHKCTGTTRNYTPTQRTRSSVTADGPCDVLC